MVLSIILAAGLWPFGAPRNHVYWINNASGLRFGDPGTVLASPSHTPNALRPAPACTLELRVRPASVRGESTLLSFYGPSRFSHFSIQQSDADLLLKTAIAGSKRPKNLYVDNFFQKRALTLLTVSSGTHGTNIYANGLLLQKIAQFPISRQIFTDRFVLGTSLSQADGWSGELLGLAFYATELTPQRVLDHYRTWTSLMVPSITLEDCPIAIYPFQDHSGAIVHSLLGSGVPLVIPARFQLVHQNLLSMPWQEFHPDWSYWQDVLLNVFGFVPLGFAFCAYLACSRALRPAVLIAILTGIFVTFTIEILQAHLPTRSSDLTDVLTNTLGAGAGALLYAWKPLERLLAKIFADIDSALGSGRIF